MAFRQPCVRRRSWPNMTQPDVVARELSTLIHLQGCNVIVAERFLTSEEAAAPPNGQCEQRNELSRIVNLTLEQLKLAAVYEDFRYVFFARSLCCC